MSSLLEDLIPNDYEKNYSEQTDGGRRELAPSEVLFTQTALDQKPENWETWERYWGYGGEFIATEAVTMPFDTHESNFLIGNLADQEQIKRKGGING